MKLSASSLNLFLRCPYAYYLKELEKVQPAYSERVFVGKLVHKTLENYFLYKKENPDTPTSLLDFLEDSYKEVRESHEISSTSALNYKDESVDYLKNYENIAKQIQPLEVEKNFEIIIDDITISGYIDLIDKNRKIIDYKTTNQKSIKPSPEYRMQLSVYSLTGLGNSYALHYITPTLFKEFEIKPLKTSFIHEILNNFRTSYLSGAFIPAGLTHPYACQYCAYSQYCKFHKDFTMGVAV